VKGLTTPVPILRRSPAREEHDVERDLLVPRQGARGLDQVPLYRDLIRDFV
jgi:hypothetical protein